MSSCNLENCLHFYELNGINENLLAVQNENISLKKEIESLKCDQQQLAKAATNKEYYQFLLEINKENQELCSQLLDSKRVVAELQPKLEHVLRSITNIEHTIQKKNKKLEELTASDDSHLDTSDSQISPAAAHVENTEVQAVKTETPCNYSTEGIIELDEDSTDEEEDCIISNTSEISCITELQPLTVDQGTILNSTQDTAFLIMSPNMGYQELSDQKPVIAECSICHMPFAQYTDARASASPLLCDKCKQLPLSSGGVVFQYPKTNNSVLPQDKSMWLDSIIPQSEASTSELNGPYSNVTDTKLYPCHLCGKKFTRSHGLKKHIRIHTGEKPYVCKICGKCFAVSGRLALHIRIHTGEKPYECKFCGKKFNENSKLKIHYRKHTGEKPFTCEVCDKGFSQMTTLTAHCRRHVSETRNKCNRCGNGFRNPNVLRAHHCLEIHNLAQQGSRTETILGNDR